MKELQSTAALSIIEETKLSFSFTFPNFLGLTTTTAQVRICSPWISDNKGRKWYFVVCPEGSGAANASWVSVFMGCSHTITTCSFMVTLQHRSKDPTKAHQQHDGAHHTIQAGSTRCWHQYISRETMPDYIMSNGAVTFEVMLAIQNPTEHMAAASRPICPLAPSDSRIFSQYLSATYADMTIIADGERLPAHRTIVCPRSDVFRAMFEHPMQEASTSEVHVGGEFSAAAIKAMLHFLYADMIPTDALQEHAPQLLRLAAFYQVANLQGYVEDYMDMSLDIVIALLQVAPQHASQPFWQRVQHFLIGHAQQLMTERKQVIDSLDHRTASRLLRAVAGAAIAVEEEEEQDEGEAAGGGEEKAADAVEEKVRQSMKDSSEPTVV